MKTVRIFMDTESVSWGNNNNLVDTDSPFKANLKHDFSTDINGNVLNSSGIQINYSNSTFTTPKPLRIVSESGDTDYLDLFSIFSGISMLSTSLRPSLANSTLRATSRTQRTCFGFAKLNDTAKKSDGTDATTESEAVYFEIEIIYGKLDNISIIEASIEATDLRLSGSFSNNNMGITFLFLDKTTMSPVSVSGGYGKKVSFNGYNGTFFIMPFNFNVTTNGNNYTSNISKYNFVAGDRYYFGISNSSISYGNETKKIFSEFSFLANQENYYIMPCLYVIGGENESGDSLAEFDNLKLNYVK